MSDKSWTWLIERFQIPKGRPTSYNKEKVDDANMVW